MSDQVQEQPEGPLSRDDFEEAQRLLREGDEEGLAEFASRNVKERARGAAQQARALPLRALADELADLRSVVEMLPRVEDGTATIMEVAQRRATALEYVERLERASREQPAGLLELLRETWSFAAHPGNRELDDWNDLERRVLAALASPGSTTTTQEDEKP